MTTLLIDGQKASCPVCELVHATLAYLEVSGPSHMATRDKKLACPVCHRTWESVAYFIDGWCPTYIPRIEAEMQEANILYNPEQEKELEIWKWKRERQAREAIDRGTWHPVLSDHHLPSLSK